MADNRENWEHRVPLKFPFIIEKHHLCGVYKCRRAISEIFIS